jgi:hypothetical protein
MKAASKERITVSHVLSLGHKAIKSMGTEKTHQTSCLISHDLNHAFVSFAILWALRTKLFACISLCPPFASSVMPMTQTAAKCASLFLSLRT